MVKYLSIYSLKIKDTNKPNCSSD